MALDVRYGEIRSEVIAKLKHRREKWRICLTN